VIRNLVPKEYRPLLDYISPAAFRVINWKSAVAQFVSLSKHALENDYLEDLSAYNRRFLSENINLEKKQTDLKSFSEVDKRFAGQILDIYFSQFFSNKGCFLDLRLKNFGEHEGMLSWNPCSFAHTFEKKFRIGMLAIYEGYYFENSAQMKNGMLAVGLIKSRDQEEVAEISKLTSVRLTIE